MIRIEAIGNVGADSEIKVLGGTEALKFRMAAKGSRRDAESQWLSCTLFGKRATGLVAYVKKGQKLFIRGEAKIREWESNGKRGVDLDVTVDELELVGEKREATASATRRDPFTMPGDDEPLPF